MPRADRVCVSVCVCVCVCAGKEEPVAEPGWREARAIDGQKKLKTAAATM
jgi:hypothetical protein